MVAPDFGAIGPACRSRQLRAPTSPHRVAGIVPDKAEDSEAGFDPDVAVARKISARWIGFILFAMTAAAEAIAQAGWTPEELRRHANEPRP